MNGEKIGYYSAEKNHLEIYLYDSRIPATKLYGDVELNGDDYFSGYFVLEDENGETIAEDNEVFTRLGGNADTGNMNESFNDVTSANETEGETVMSGNPIKSIIIGNWWDETAERDITFCENGEIEMESEILGSYSVDGSTVKISSNNEDTLESGEFTIESFSAVHLVLSNGNKKYSLSKKN